MAEKQSNPDTPDRSEPAAGDRPAATDPSVAGGKAARKRAAPAKPAPEKAARKKAAHRATPKKAASKQPAAGESTPKQAASKKAAQKATPKKPPAKKLAGEPASPRISAKKAAKEPAAVERTSAEQAASEEVAATETRPATTEPASEPAELAGGRPASAEAGAAVGRSGPPSAWTEAVWEALRHPDQPPRRLAALAVAEVGPRAATWVDWLRRTYPGAPADGIARLATRHATWSARAVAVLGAAGPVTMPVALPAAGWVRASLVLRIAAAYGADPGDPSRAEDLIELLDQDRSALASVATGPGHAADDLPAVGSVLGRAAGLLRRVESVRFALRPPRLRPSVLAVVGVLTAVGDHGDRVERLAHRAVRYYRGGSQSRSDTSAASTSSRNSP